MLKELYKIFGDWTLVIASYNCGPGNVSKAIKRAGGVKDYWTIYPYLPRETRGYVPAFIAANYIMNYYCEHNICPAEARLPLGTDTIMVTSDLNLETVSQRCNIDLEELKALNPQYRTNRVPGGAKPCVLRMPMDAINAFIEAGDSIYCIPQSNRISASGTALSGEIGTATDVDPDISRRKNSYSRRRANYTARRSRSYQRSSRSRNSRKAVRRR